MEGVENGEEIILLIIPREELLSNFFNWF